MNDKPSMKSNRKSTSLMIGNAIHRLNWIDWGKGEAAYEAMIAYAQKTWAKSYRRDAAVYEAAARQLAGI